MHSRSTRARLAPLTLAGALALLTTHAPLAAQGTLRQLSCRGASGIALRVDQDPSPRDPASVVMSLDYRRPATPPLDVKRLPPGTCTWNPQGFAGVPIEPGRVRFDVRREAQPWSATGARLMDTTIRAGAFFPDPISLPRYLGDSSHYWTFFLNDATNLSTSFGPSFESGVPTYVTIRGPVVLANNARRELLCRGGSAGLQFGAATSAGTNLAKLVLTYRVSSTVPGPAGYGLSPGACSWTDRSAPPPEPGRIVFTTATNAQLKQIQSGSAVDRSPTAAERWPDVKTIPAYLTDPQHYWSFTVMAADPDSALANGAWKRDLTDVVATSRATAGSTTRSVPSSPGSEVFRPGGAGSTTATSAVFDIRNVVVSPLLENAVIGFTAAPNIAPIVTLTPVAGGAPINVPVQGSAQGTMWRYVGSSKTPLARNTSYTYVISAPATANARANQKSGQFRTLSQRATISITQINLISDGDKESDGELVFDFDFCPSVIEGYYLSGPEGTPMSWGEGIHRTNVQLKSTKEVPDRFQMMVLGVEVDMGMFSFNNGRDWPKQKCSSPVPGPGRNLDFEWNPLVVDFDLSKYPGAKAGDSFVKRSRLPAKGGSLMFEIRGAFQVTRQ